MVVYKAKKSDTGGQFYQSDAHKKNVLLKSKTGENTKLQEAVEKALSKKMRSGEISPEDNASRYVDMYFDSVSDAIHNPPKSKGTGKAVMKGRGGKFKGVK